MSVKDVANGLVERCRKGDFTGAVETFYDDDIVSVEAAGTPEYPAETRGKDKVRAKNEKWMENTEVHSFNVEGPFVGDDGFAVRYTFDVTDKPSGRRTEMTEMALYKVQDDRITHERFFYNAPGQ